MRHEDTGRDPRREAADADPMSYTPGATEDTESAAARATRTDASDTTSLRPPRVTDTDGGEKNADEGDPQAHDAGRREGPGTVADPLR